MGTKKGYKTHANLDSFAVDLALFKNERSVNLIENKAEPLTNSTGRAIDTLNECLEAYNTFCGNVNDIYAATERYLEEALTNLQSGDKDSTMIIR